MMTDKQLMFSEEQALTDGALSDNIVRVGPGDVGVGNNMSFFAAVNGATGPLTAVVMTGDMEDMSDAAELPVDYKASAAKVALGGVVIRGRLPAGCKTYLRIKFNGAAGGVVTAGLVKDA